MEDKGILSMQTKILVEVEALFHKKLEKQRFEFDKRLEMIEKISKSNKQTNKELNTNVDKFVETNGEIFKQTKKRRNLLEEHKI